MIITAIAAIPVTLTKKIIPQETMQKFGKLSARTQSWYQYYLPSDLQGNCQFGETVLFIRYCSMENGGGGPKLDVSLSRIKAENFISIPATAQQALSSFLKLSWGRSKVPTLTTIFLTLSGISELICG